MKALVEKIIEHWGDIAPLLREPVFDAVENCALSESGVAVFIKIRCPEELECDAPCITLAFELLPNREADDPELYVPENLIFADEADCTHTI